MTIRTSISKGKYWLVLIALSCLCLSACEEYFRPELEDFDPVLIIDGAITDMPGPYTINLSFSSGVFADDQQAVEGATIKIIEEGGEQETLTESQAGHYTTSINGIQGTPGKSYKISIQLQDGNQYESDYQKMPATIAIDSVGTNLEYRYLSIEEPNVPGFQFHVTTEQAENSENYLLWSLEATFKYRADFTIDYVYDNRRIDPYPNPTEFMTCWRTDQVNEIYTFNTSVLSDPKIEQLPLNFAIIGQRELSIRYSLLVKQFTITEEANTFWNKLKGQVENQGTLHSSQPFQFRGNIYNVDNPDEMVLGFFMVAGLNEKRIFVDHPEEFGLSFSYCEPDYMSYGSLGLFSRALWPIYIYEDPANNRAVANDECFDCRELGGTIIRPEFWEE